MFFFFSSLLHEQSLTITEVAVYSLAYDFLAKRKKTAVAVSSLAEELGISERTVKRALEKLINKDLIIMSKNAITKIKNNKGAKLEKKGLDKDKIVASWNALAEVYGLSTILIISKSRETQYRKRIEQIGGEDAFWGAVSKALSESQFLQGKNDRGWGASFDFFLRESSFLKAVEGAYRDKNKKEIATLHCMESSEELLDALLN